MTIMIETAEAKKSPPAEAPWNTPPAQDSTSNKKERHCHGTKPTDWPLIVILEV